MPVGNLSAAVLVACASMAALVTFAVLCTIFSIVFNIMSISDHYLFYIWSAFMVVPKFIIFLGAIPVLALGAPLFYCIDRRLGMSWQKSIGLGLGLSVPFLMFSPLGLIFAIASVSIAYFTWAYVMWWRKRDSALQ